MGLAGGVLATGIIVLVYGVTEHHTYSKWLRQPPLAW
jgi:hypothetical protein